eukprot:6233652-Prorocentrum_lima.AAC.1
MEDIGCGLAWHVRRVCEWSIDGTAQHPHFMVCFCACLVSSHKAWQACSEKHGGKELGAIGSLLRDVAQVVKF